MRSIGWYGLAFLSLAIAAYAVVAYGFLPFGAAIHPDMRPAFEAQRAGVYVHVFASAFALALGPFQFSARLRARRIGLHRWMGRLYLGIGVLVGGGAGLYVATGAFGGPVARAGFATLALVWLYTGLRAYLAIRARDADTHRRWMVRNYALACAAITLRFYVPGSFLAGIPLEAAYPAIAWLCWVPNLLVAELAFNRARLRPA